MLGRVIAREGKNRKAGFDARHQQGSGTGFRHADNRRHTIQVIGRVHGRQGDRLIHMLHAFMNAVLGLMHRRMLFCAHANSHHGFHRFRGVVADRRFCRQHDRVGVVHHRVRHVGNLRPGRHRVFDHRLHHLGGGNHHRVQGAGAVDDVLLNAHQLGVANLNS